MYIQYIIYENEIGLVLSHLCSGALQVIYIQHVNDMLQVCFVSIFIYISSSRINLVLSTLV